MIKDKLRVFCRENLIFSPEEEGVYALYLDGELIYYGGTEDGQTLRSRLIEHFNGHREPVTVSHYKRELTAKPDERPWPHDWERPKQNIVKPLERLKQLAKEYAKEHGTFPIFNINKVEKPPEKSA